MSFTYPPDPDDGPTPASAQRSASGAATQRATDVPDDAADVAVDADALDAAPAAKPGVEELTEALAASQGRVGSLTEDLQRVQAEYVNYKRRVDRDRDLVRQNATFSVLSAMLPVLDDIDRAREHGELEGGFKAVADSLDRIVAGQGLVKFGKPGDPFDPRFHEALMHAHSAEVTTTTCRDIISAGYQIGERVVRPAQVTVVDPEPDPPAAPEPEAPQDAEPGPAPTG